MYLIFSLIFSKTRKKRVHFDKYQDQNNTKTDYRFGRLSLYREYLLQFKCVNIVFVLRSTYTVHT